MELIVWLRYSVPSFRLAPVIPRARLGISLSPDMPPSRSITSDPEITLQINQTPVLLARTDQVGVRTIPLIQEHNPVSLHCNWCRSWASKTKRSHAEEYLGFLIITSFTSNSAPFETNWTQRRQNRRSLMKKGTLKLLELKNWFLEVECWNYWSEQILKVMYQFHHKLDALLN